MTGQPNQHRLPAPEELARWQELADQATAGPWKTGDTNLPCYGDGCDWCANPDWSYGRVEVLDDAGDLLFYEHLREATPDWTIISSPTSEVCGTIGYDGGGVCSTPADAQFIAAARQAVPALLALVQHQQNQLAELGGQLHERTRDYYRLIDVARAVGLVQLEKPEAGQ